MSSFVNLFIEKLDKQFKNGAYPKINVEPLGGFELFQEKYKVLLMNCFLNALLNQKELPNQSFNVAVIVTNKGDIVINVHPENIFSGLEEARREFELHEYYEKAAICRDYMERIRA